MPAGPASIWDGDQIRFSGRCAGIELRGLLTASWFSGRVVLRTCLACSGGRCPDSRRVKHCSHAKAVCGHQVLEHVQTHLDSAPHPIPGMGVPCVQYQGLPDQRPSLAIRAGEASCLFCFTQAIIWKSVSGGRENVKSKKRKSAAVPEVKVAGSAVGKVTWYSDQLHMGSEHVIQ